MNIIWFTWKDLDNPLAGGAEVVNEELATRAARDGHKVTFLVSGFKNAPSRLSRRGFDIIRTGSRATNYITAASYFRAHRWQLAPDLIIDECNTMPYFAGWYAKAPTILFFHMLCRSIWFYELPWPLGVIGYLVEPLYLRLLRPKTSVIAMSNSTKRDLVRQGYRSANVHVIPEGIGLAPIDSLEAITKFAEPTLLSHGNIRTMKRTLDQVKAFELAKDVLPSLKLVVSGQPSGSYGRRVADYISRSRYAGSIEIAGKTTEAQKVVLMQKCHLLLVTSVKEGWGLIVTEAASQGTPAVVYDVDGLRDSVKSGSTGIITNRNSPEAMASAITTLLSRTPEYERLRQAGWLWSRELTFDAAYDEFSGYISAPARRA
jgi:glycosyltransferase involved in cell wall biosynthesis